MIRSNKLSNYMERVIDSKKPITADVFLTDYCNARCSYCRYNHKSGKFMSYDNFVKYAKRLLELGVRGIILTGGGEPTINPDFERITEWLESNKIPYGVNTNLIRPALCNPDFLKVSIDSGDKERYTHLRGVNKLDVVLANLSYYIEQKIKNGWKTRIGVQCVATNKDDVISFYESVKGFNVDYIYFRPLESVGENGVSEIEVRGWLKGFDDNRIQYSYKFDLKDYKPEKCYGNWSVVTIDCNGDVMYCCHFPNEIVGNIMDDNILEKKNNHKCDMSKCEHPCRLSGANWYLDNLQVEQDIAFV